MDIESLKRRLAGSPHSMQHALNELKTPEIQISLSEALQLLEPLLNQRLQKCDEDVLQDAFDFIDRIIVEFLDQKLWAKLLDPTNLLYKSETESSIDLLSKVKNKIADIDNHQFWNRNKNQVTSNQLSQPYFIIAEVFKLTDNLESVSFISLSDLSTVVQVQNSDPVKENFIRMSLVYSQSQINEQTDPGLRKSAKKQIFDFCNTLNQLATAQLKSVVQEIELNISLALILSPVLDSKTIGTSLLSMRVLNPTSKEDLNQWCDKHDIFQIFFSRCIHAELIKRSSYLLDYLHRNDRLKEAQIQQMWHVATKKHEAFRNAVLKSLILLVQKSLKFTELNFLVQKLKILPYKDFSRNSFDLLKAIIIKLSPKQIQQKIENSNSFQAKFFDKKTNRPRSMSDSHNQPDVLLPKLEKVKSDRQEVIPYLVQTRLQNQIQTNPFEVPTDQQDKNTGDEEFSAKSGPRNNRQYTNQINIDVNFDFQNPNQLIEEEKVQSSDFGLLKQIDYKVMKTSSQDSENSQLISDCLKLFWQLVMDDSVLGNQVQIIGQSRTNLSLQCHQIAIEYFCEILCYHQTNSLFYFIKLAVENLRQNKFTITMQTVIQKLVTTVQFPLDGQNMPKNRQELIQVLERDLKLTQCILGSLIEFKRSCLDNILSQNNFGLQEEDNLETQSSLDEEEFKAEIQLDERQQNSFTTRIEEEKEESKDINQNRGPRQNQAAGDRSFLDVMITNKLYNFSYYKEIQERQNFLKFLVVICPEYLLNRKILEMLWEILVQDAFYEKERDLYFVWSQDLLLALQLQQTHSQLKSSYMEAEGVFADDCLELIYFETLLRLDPKSYTQSMFSCFKEFFLHTNSQYGQIEMLALGNFKAYSHNLIGIETLWQIVLTSKDENTHKLSLEFLINLLKRLEMTEEVKLYILDICLASIKNGLIIVDENVLMIARSVSVLNKIITEFELKQHEKVQKQNPIYKITVTNQIFNSQGPTKIELSLPSNTTIAVLVDQLANSVFPRRSSRELNLIYKGKDLKEMLKTLKDVCQTQPILMFLTAKSDIELEYEQLQTQGKQQFGETEIQEAVQNLKEFLGGCEVSDKVVGLALRKCNLDLGDAIGMLTSEDIVADLQAELNQEETEQTPVQNSNEKENMFIHKVLSSNLVYFNLLFDLLNLGYSQITQIVWSLLNQISVNIQLFTELKTLNSIKQISEEEYVGWDQLIDPHHVYKMLYALQIVQQLADAGQNKGNSEVQADFNSTWKFSFIQKGGLAYLYQMLMTFQTSKNENIIAHQLPIAKRKSRKKAAAMQRQNELKIQKNDQIQCLALLVNLVQYFTTAALLSFNQQPSFQQIIQNSFTSPFRKKLQFNNQGQQHQQLVDVLEIKSEQTSTDKASQDTPKFNYSSSGEGISSLKEPQQTNQQQQIVVDNFPKFVSQIDEQIATKILFQIINLPEIVTKMLSLANQNLPDEQEVGSLFEQQAQLILHCIDTVVPLVIWQQNLVNQLLESESLPQILIRALKCDNQNVRQCVERFFRLISQQFPNFASFVLVTLIQQLSQCQDYKEEYFKLLASVSILLPNNFFLKNEENNYCQTDESMKNQKFSTETILATLNGLIDSNKKNESLLAGVFQFLWAIIEIQPKIKDICREKFDLVNRLSKLLFLPEINHQSTLIQNSNQLFLSQKQTRKRCMDVLKILAVNNTTNFDQILNQIDKFQSKIKGILRAGSISEFFANQGQTKSKLGYVGLRNFGCTCYMNSLLQQLYMIDELRNYVINFDEPVQDDVVIELQKIFCNLQESQKMYYSPSVFTQVFQFIRGEQINVKQMQDSHEFFNILIDNIENAHPYLKKFLQKSLGGTLINEIKSLEPDFQYQSKREEPFYCLSLDIKNKKSIQEAFDMFVKPDILEGENKYFCEKYNTKIDASRRNYIKSVNDTVVINLKRFEFDFNLLQHIKINDFMEFPKELDLRPWTEAELDEEQRESNSEERNIRKQVSESLGRYSDHEAMSEETPLQNGCSSENDGKSDSGFEDLIGENKPLVVQVKVNNLNQGQKISNQYLYELVGVLVHSGSANSGHYYSYIKERDGQGRWLEFNDTKVTEFDVEQLAEKCFGNKKENQSEWQIQMGHPNAYLLFYQKKTAGLFNELSQKRIIQTTAADVTIERPIQMTRSKLILKEISDENDAFLHLNLFLDFDYFQFLWEFISQSQSLVKNLDTDQSQLTQRYLNLATTFAFDMITEVKETKIFVQWMPLLEKIYSNCSKDQIEQLLGYLQQHKLFDQLFQHSNGEVREQFITFLAGTLFKIKRVQVFDQVIQPFQKYKTFESSESVISCVKQIVDILNDLGKMTVQAQNDYFDFLISYILKNGAEAAGLLLQEDIIGKVIKFIQSKDIQESQSVVKPLDLLSIVVQSSATKGVQDLDNFAPTSRFQKEEDEVQLSQENELLLLQSSFITTVYQFCRDATKEVQKDIQQSLHNLMLHLSWGNDQNYQTFLKYLNEASTKDENWNKSLLKMSQKLTAAINQTTFLSDQDEDDEVNFDIDEQIGNLNTSFGQDFN